MQTSSPPLRPLFALTDGSPSRSGIVAVIPAYNEERFIGSVVLSASKWADKVIVVDDGSTDTTADLAQAAGATVIHHQENRGKGVALNSGIRYARRLQPKAVVVLDADGQHMAHEITDVCHPVLEGEADIVVGSRYLASGQDIPRHRILGHRLFNFMTNQAAGVTLTDSQSGFRAFSPRAVRLLSFQSNGFAVESEMQFLAQEHHLRVQEVAISAQYRDKPKRPVLQHGMIVLHGLMWLVGQYRPLLFFGLPGWLILLTGLIGGLHVISIYQNVQVLALGYALISTLFMILGVFTIFTGVILHSVRGLILGAKANNERGEWAESYG